MQGLALPCTRGAMAQLCHVPDDGWGGNGRDGNGGGLGAAGGDNFLMFLFQSSASAPDVDDPEAFPALS